MRNLQHKFLNGFKLTQNDSAIQKMNRLCVEAELFAYAQGGSSADVREFVAERKFRGAFGVDPNRWTSINVWREDCSGTESSQEFA